MQLSDIVPSRVYSWVYEAPAKLLVGGKARTNPLADEIVTVRKVKSGMAATAEMLHKKQLELDPNYSPDPSYTPRFEETGFPCVVRSLSTGDLQVRIMGSKSRKVEYFVNARPATVEEVTIIKAHLPKRTANPKRAKVEFPYVDNLQNVDNNMAEMEEEDND